MGVVLYGLAIILVAWAAYNIGWSRGSAEGYEDGWRAGLKKGTDEGMKAGLKAGIKEQMLTSLIEQPKVKNIPHPELHEQVRKEILTALDQKPSSKKTASSPPSSNLLLPVLQKFGLWFALCLLILIVAYLGR